MCVSFFLWSRGLRIVFTVRGSVTESELRLDRLVLGDFLDILDALDEVGLLARGLVKGVPDSLAGGRLQETGQTQVLAGFYEEGRAATVVATELPGLVVPGQQVVVVRPVGFVKEEYRVVVGWVSAMTNTIFFKETCVKIRVLCTAVKTAIFYTCNLRLKLRVFINICNK